MALWIHSNTIVNDPMTPSSFQKMEPPLKSWRHHMNLEKCFVRFPEIVVRYLVLLLYLFLPVYYRGSTVLCCHISVLHLVFIDCGWPSCVVHFAFYKAQKHFSYRNIILKSVISKQIHCSMFHLAFSSEHGQSAQLKSKRHIIFSLIIILNVIWYNTDECFS